MRKYNFKTGGFVDVDVPCDICGKVIDAAFGVRGYYEEGEDGKKVLKHAGSCCVGKIRASNVISKKARDAYRAKGQIPESVLKKLPKAPPPGKTKNAGKKASKFIDVVGRSKKAGKSKGKKIIKSSK